MQHFFRWPRVIIKNWPHSITDYWRYSRQMLPKPGTLKSSLLRPGIAADESNFRPARWRQSCAHHNLLRPPRRDAVPPATVSMLFFRKTGNLVEPLVRRRAPSRRQGRFAGHAVVAGVSPAIVHWCSRHGCRYSGFVGQHGRLFLLNYLSSSFTSAKAFTAKSRSSREFAADTCVRIRAVPCATTG